MKLWKENRTDKPWEPSNKEIAKQFKESQFSEYNNSTEFNLINFISDPEGLDSIWEWDKKKGSIQGSPDILEILKIIEEAE